MRYDRPKQLWVLPVEGRGHYLLVQGAEHRPFLLTPEGRIKRVAEQGPSLDAVFRGTDEDIDPGLAERIQVGVRRHDKARLLEDH